MRENDRKKFVRLANQRVNKAIKYMRLIGNLSNRSNYDFTAEDVEKIFRAMQEEMVACRRRFDLAIKVDNKKDPFILD